MTRLTELAHAAVRTVLAAGEASIDATAGNGHDTRFLSVLVGPMGSVFAFDIQPEALARTAQKLHEASNVTLCQRDHAEMRNEIPPEFHGRIGAVMFNLGYLPGGDKSFTTQADSTLKAIASALELLRSGGILTVVAYIGHPGGSDEAEAVTNLLAKLPAGFSLREERNEESISAAPRLFVVHKRLAVG
ncbi:MAG: class I SAM-dependent methyltransferase [Planctomycetia bacterium]|nr:class I SAM-dependent methyltransferase [Planctomycetia bacterium]